MCKEELLSECLRRFSPFDGIIHEGKCVKRPKTEERPKQIKPRKEDGREVWILKQLS